MAADETEEPGTTATAASQPAGDGVRVFAYGSNLCRERIGLRVASARPLTVARLDGYTLRFHKRGRDGSAKADAHHTGRGDDVVWGVVYEMDEADKHVLDRYEGLGQGYGERRVEVTTERGDRMRAWMYQADPAHVDAGLRPFTWYRALVAEGARQHGLAPDYITDIESVEVVEDADRDRHVREMRVIEIRTGKRS